MAVQAAVQCANTECRVADSGKCVEGLETSQCSHFGRPRPAAASTTPRVAGVPLLGARHLTHVLAVEQRRSVDSRLVAVIAPVGSGKTSLIAATYDLFQHGPVNGIAFARSATLHAFEMACHDSRAASLRDEPEQERTSRAALSFYHLQVAMGPEAKQRGLLLADRSGEDYRAVVDDPAAARGLSEVRRADVLTVLVDGKRLLDNGERHNVRSDLELLVKALVDTDTCRPRQHLCIVLTKLDEVMASPARKRAEADFARIAGNLRDHHGDFFESTNEYRIAASPKVTGVARGEGVPALLSQWVRCSVPVAVAPPAVVVASRAFGRITP